jgi:hypothetical protein
LRPPEVQDEGSHDNRSGDVDQFVPDLDGYDGLGGSFEELEDPTSPLGIGLREALKTEAVKGKEGGL